MRSLNHTLFLLTVLTLVGCSTVQVSQDYDPHADLSRYGTWQWRETVQPKTGDIRADNPLLDKRIRRSIANHFAGRHFNETTTQPDILLSYHLNIERKIYSDTTYSSVGVGGFYYPWYGGMGTETRIWQYDESRLTIDIEDAHTGELVWRGVGVYRFKAYKTPQEAEAAIQQTVDKILQQFPPPNTP